MLAKLQHRTQGEMADGKSEVEMAARPGVSGAGAFAEHVSLRPEPATIRAGAYLWKEETRAVPASWKKWPLDQRCLIFLTALRQSE